MEVAGVAGARTLEADSAGRRPLLPLERARLTHARGSCARPVRVRPVGSSVITAGASLTGRGTWVRGAGAAAPSRWPGDPYHSGFVALDTVLRVDAVRPGRHPLLSLRGSLQARLGRLYPRHFSLAEALLLGRRERMESDVRDRFARAGLVHLLAISGAHVGLFAAMVLLMAAALRVPRARATWVTILLVTLYLGVIGAPASAVRAGIMLSLALVARLLQRPSSAFPIIAAAAMVMVALTPEVVLDPGFQLSFAGVLALIASRKAPVAALGPVSAHPVGRWVADALVVSAVAFLFTAPITAHHFGVVAPISILANLPAVPLTSLALIAIVLSCVVDPVSPAVAGLIADGGSVAIDAVDRVVGFAAAVPFGSVGMARPDWTLWVLMAFAALLAARATLGMRTAVRWVTVGALPLAALLARGSAVAAPAEPLEIHFIDVGQGDAVAIRTPAGRWLLMDAGARTQGSDAGERRVLPFLRAHRADRLTALILTHPDADHIGGAPAVLRGIPVDRVIEPGLAVGKGIYLELLDVVEERQIQWMAARTGRSLHVDGVELRFLWPDSLALAGAPEANDVSTVVMLRYGAFRALFTGDAPAEVETLLVERQGSALRAAVLKAGHHGSATSTSEELLSAARPALIVVSAGRRNRYGHPAPEVLRRIRSHGIEIARTDLQGTISLRVRGPSGNQWERLDR